MPGQLSGRAAPEDGGDGRGRPQAATFDDIYRLWGGRVLNLAYRLTNRDDAARDLTQDIFIKVYENLETFRHQSELYTWIHRIALNHILNHLKRERRYRWMNLMDERVADILESERARGDGPPSPEQRPDRLVEQSERERILRSGIDSLPVKYRVPFVLFRYEGMSYKEIAVTMDLSMSAVETRIHRAKKELIKKLKPWLNEI